LSAKVKTFKSKFFPQAVVVIDKSHPALKSDFANAVSGNEKIYTIAFYFKLILFF
jgi:hypothetical protein